MGLVHSLALHMLVQKKFMILFRVEGSLTLLQFDGGKGSKSLRIYDVIYGETKGQKLRTFSGTLIANINENMKIIWTK